MNETIWVTGASSGIGFHISMALAKAGNKVIVSARSESKLSEMEKANENIIALPFDVSDKSQIESVRQALEKHVDNIDRVIMNAGTCEYFEVDTPDWDMMRRVMDVNFFGAVNTLELVMPLLKSGAHIVAVSSMATFAPFTKSQAYGSSKAALTYLMSTMKVDLQKKNIDVSIVNPGFVDTPLTQQNDFSMPFLMGVEEAANIIVSQLDSRMFTIDFPLRFKLILKMAYFFPTIWFKYIAPRLSV
jgi:short-subunit dehydrogenase